MDVQTQAWTNSLLHVPQPQSKDTFIFTAATHKQRMCLHASRSRISQTVFCTVHVQCTHSARYSARHSARPQNAVNTMGLAFCWQCTKNYKNIFFFCVFWLFLGKYVVQGCPNDPLENQMMKPNFESHKQNQTNTWWQSAGLLFRTQIGLPLLTIEFLLVRSPKSALQRWRLGWSDKLTGFLRDEALFALVFLLSNYVLFPSGRYQRE